MRPLGGSRVQIAVLLTLLVVATILLAGVWEPLVI